MFEFRRRGKNKKVNHSGGTSKELLSLATGPGEGGRSPQVKAFFFHTPVDSMFGSPSILVEAVFLSPRFPLWSSLPHSVEVFALLLLFVSFFS